MKLLVVDDESDALFIFKLSLGKKTTKINSTFADLRRKFI